MALRLNSPTTSPEGDAVATRLIGSPEEHHQQFLVEFDDGSGGATLVASGAGLPVNVVAGGLATESTLALSRTTRVSAVVTVESSMLTRGRLGP